MRRNAILTMLGHLNGKKTYLERLPVSENGRNAREPVETYAYNLAQICRILEFLPLLPKAVVATAAFAGLRSGELGGLEWTDYSGDALNVKRSVWRTFVNQPKTRASAKPVPVIRQLAEIWIHIEVPWAIRSRV